MNPKNIINPIMFVFIIVIAATIIGSIIFNTIDTTKKDQFCCKEFPTIEKDRIPIFNKACGGNTRDIEIGYINCYREYIDVEDHTIKTDTKIMELPK